MKTIFAGIILMAVIFGIWFFYPSVQQQKDEILESKRENNVSYVCGDSKTIQATYVIGVLIPVPPGERPIPNGSVDILLSDGRILSLPHTISASGVRYANSDESIVFWTKGNSAFLLEDNKETYKDCVAL